MSGVRLPARAWSLTLVSQPTDNLSNLFLIIDEANKRMLLNVTVQFQRLDHGSELNERSIFLAACQIKHLGHFRNLVTCNGICYAMPIIFVHS